MKAHRTHDSRMINFSDPALRFDGAAALRKRIVQFVFGINGERKNPVSEKQIVAWFKSTSPDFVRKQLTEVVAAGVVRPVRLSMTRRINRAYRYEAVPFDASKINVGDLVEAYRANDYRIL